MIICPVCSQPVASFLPPYDVGSFDVKCLGGGTHTITKLELKGPEVSVSRSIDTRNDPEKEFIDALIEEYGWDPGDPECFEPILNIFRRLFHEACEHCGFLSDIRYATNLCPYCNRIMGSKCISDPSCLCQTRR